jgi:hypothetical protein
MRHVVASSLCSLVVLSVPAIASAAEAAPAAAPVAAVAAPADPYESNAHLTLSLDGNDQGLGLRAGIRYKWFEAQLGSDTAIFDHREYLGLKVMPLASDVISPYLYGRLGSWVSEPFWGDEEHHGTYHSFGGGVDLNVARHFYLYGEFGLGARDDEGQAHSEPTTETTAEVHLGLGFRF